MSKPLFLIISAFLFVFVACDGGDDGSGKGTLEIYLTNDQADHSTVFIGIEQVLVHQSDQAGEADAGWKKVPLNPELVMPINLTESRNTPALLADGVIAAGHYRQVRLVLKENTLTENLNYVILELPDNNGKEKISMEMTDLEKNRLNSSIQFSISEDETTRLTIHFDTGHPVIDAGNDDFILKPAIMIVNENNPSEIALKEQIDAVYNEILQVIGEAACSDWRQCGAVPIYQDPRNVPEFFLAYSDQDTDEAKLYELAETHKNLMKSWYGLAEYEFDSGLIKWPRVECVADRCTIME